ncbi:MAG: ferritin family protein [Thermoanaerobaculales bacterium]|nr:ferritin family protein [Thermoanaerobaculales bacterium]
MQFSNVDEILDYAIEREDRAAKMYAELAHTVERPGIREAFLEFAAEEGRHKVRLMKIKAEGTPAVNVEKISDLKITEDLVEPKISKHMNYQEVLVFAMKSEKLAFILYTKLAEACTDPGLAEVFRGLAQEEAKHKLHFEMEYDDRILEGI